MKAEDNLMSEHLEAAAVRVAKALYGEPFDPFQNPEQLAFCMTLAGAALNYDADSDNPIEAAWVEVRSRLNAEHAEGIIDYSELKAGVNNAARIRDAALAAHIPEVIKDKGPWSVGSDDGRRGDGDRIFLESNDFTHDVRLYINGDFRDDEQREAYARGVLSDLTRGTVMREALEEIVAPVTAMQKRAEEEGNVLSGMAHQIANSPSYLQGIAQQALDKIT